MSAQIDIKGFIKDQITGSRSFDLLIESSETVDHVEEVVLASGDNTFTNPANYTGAIVIPDPNSTVTTKTLKGATGDTGVRLHETKPSVISLGTQANFIITASQADTGYTTTVIWF